MNRVREAGRALWRIAVLALVAGACQEDLTAPGVCPAYCPSAGIRLVDTIIAGAVAQDSTFTGYVPAHSAAAIQLVSDSILASRGVVLFDGFRDTLVTEAGAGPVVALDSLELTVPVLRRSSDSGLTLALYRLPVAVDSSTTFADLDSAFEDFALITTVEIPDSLPGDTLHIVLPGAAFPEHLGADSLRLAIGLALRSSQPGFVDIGTVDGGFATTVARHVRVDVGDGQLVVARDFRSVSFDTYVHAGISPAPPGVLVAGGAPSSRALLRLELPPAIADSADVVRATLVLVPAEPVIGAAGDHIVFRADPVIIDVGPKSPIGAAGQDSLTRVALRSGSRDAVRLDITSIVRSWQRDTSLARSLVVRAEREAAGVGELRAFSRESGQGPVLHVTYVPLGRERRR